MKHPPRPRPYVPLLVRYRVLLGQLGEFWPEQRVAAAKYLRSLRAAVDRQKELLAETLACAPSDLQLSHEPPLAARPFNPRTGKYKPDANDPDYLFYRTAEHHRVMTYVRGDHGDYSDVAKIKRSRRRERKHKKIKTKRAWPARKIPSRPFAKGGGKQRRKAQCTVISPAD